MSGNGDILVLGAPDGLADLLAERLRVGDRKVINVPGVAGPAFAAALTVIENLETLVVIASPPTLGRTMLEVNDADLDAGLSKFLDFFEVLHLALPRIADGGSVVTVVANGHLGGWGGAHELAFCGAVVGLMRCAALENMSRGVRANVISLELPGAGPPADSSEVADLAAYLLSPAASAVNGELILANHGRSLQMRAARDRRPKTTTAP